MKKFLIFALCSLFLMSSCDTYTGSGAYMGGSIGSILGSAIGGLSGGPCGSDMGTIIGMAGGAAVGAVIGRPIRDSSNKWNSISVTRPVELREGLLGLSSKTLLVSLAMISRVMVSEVTISLFMVRRIVRIIPMSSILPIVVMTVFTILMVKIM